ncbi:MAG: HAD-IA family hydrolase [Candidatus Omnitrophica bacterium]|nr:HAD-IA family hydrolase [Candidatus Omnitrophota bacterium]
MKQLIIYDLDGTLVDTAEDIAEATNAMLTTLTGNGLPPEEIRQCVGKGLHDLVRRALKTADEALVEQGTRLFGEYYGRHLLDHSRLYPSAVETLQYFRGRTQVVITNKPDPFAKQLLEGLGVERYFASIIATGGAYPKKPDPTAIRQLTTRMRCAPSDVLMVGDSLIDVETGRNAGVFTVILAHGFQDHEDLVAAKPDALVADLSEFLALAQGQGW